jgi:hypothetical protein
MSTEYIDKFLDAIERMIDAQDDMWQEEKYSNYREVQQIKEQKYIPAKDDAREAFRMAVLELRQDSSSGRAPD